MVKYFSKHVYEIDIIDVYLKFETGIKKGSIKYPGEISPDEFLMRLRTSIEVILKPDRIDIEQLLKFNIPAVVTPRFNNGHYDFWFAFQLMVTNPRIIPLMLLYHLERWQNNISFLNTLEFNIIKLFELNRPAESDRHADYLFQWMYEMRKKYGYQSKQKQSKKNQVIDIPYINLTKEDISSGAEVNIQSTSILLVKEELIEPIAQVFKQFLFNAKEYKNLIAAFKGEQLKKPIELTCKVNEFGYLISKLKAEPLNCILNKVDKIRDWAVLNFKFFSSKPPNTEKPSPSYMRAALVGSRPPLKKRRKELDDLIQGLANRTK